MATKEENYWMPLQNTVMDGEKYLSAAKPHLIVKKNEGSKIPILQEERKEVLIPYFRLALTINQIATKTFYKLSLLWTHHRKTWAKFEAKYGPP